MATADLHTKFREDRDMLANRQTLTHRRTDRQTDRNTSLPYQGAVIILM